MATIVNIRKLELLAPASNGMIAIESIKHGADAVYIGATSHGARASAGNSLDEIARVVDFAHSLRSKVYVTVNTIVYENELKKVETLCRDLYHLGVDALIVQDMSLLRMSLPPIALHASTQCDIRTPEKARFLQDVGFSQIVLARELTLREIKDITESVSIPVECFIHGALCVSYSGRCHASCAVTGRSANRGECAQICRLPYTLTDCNGKILAKDKYLLSLRDFNATNKISDLIESGVSSFKIEGRLKDVDYVKNITSHYDIILNNYISSHEGYGRNSFGKVIRNFVPSPEKSFNRGFTDYFLSDRRPESISSWLTPKSMGEKIKDLKLLHNGDGISFFDKNNKYEGVNINKVVDGKIFPGRKVDIPFGAQIYRTFDVEWQKKLSRETSIRKIALDIKIDLKGVSAEDERGVAVRIPLDVTCEEAHKPMDFRKEFEKLGNTIYFLRKYESDLPTNIFIPNSQISKLRKQIVKSLDDTNKINLRFDYRKEEKKDAQFPYKKVDFRDNVANSLAEKFYLSHGVNKIEKAMEIHKGDFGSDTTVMTTRHCVLRELGMCKRLVKGKFKEPLTIRNTNEEFRLHFNCADCEMEVLST